MVLDSSSEALLTGTMQVSLFEHGAHDLERDGVKLVHAARDPVCAAFAALDDEAATWEHVGLSVAKVAHALLLDGIAVVEFFDASVGKGAEDVGTDLVEA